MSSEWVKRCEAQWQVAARTAFVAPGQVACGVPPGFFFPSYLFQAFFGARPRDLANPKALFDLATEDRLFSRQ
jgi:hypothetical protein